MRVTLVQKLVFLRIGLKYSMYVQSVPYRSKIKLSHEKIDNKEETNCRPMILIHNMVFFKPNLTNEGSKERQEDPLLG